MKWFYLVTFKYPSDGGWAVKHMRDTLDMRPGETQEGAYERIRDIIVGDISGFRFDLGYFVVYHVAENTPFRAGPR